MPPRYAKLEQAVEDYFIGLRLVRSSGGATGERSLYGPLGNLLNAVGETLAPKVFCVQELADQGVGHPDLGLYTMQQVQKGKVKSGQKPERGVIEVKAVGDEAWLKAESEQVAGYWHGYRQVLVTNARDFVLVGEDAAGHQDGLGIAASGGLGGAVRREAGTSAGLRQRGWRQIGRVPDARTVPRRVAGRTQGCRVAAGILRPRRPGPGGTGRRCGTSGNVTAGAGRIAGREV